MRLPPVDVYSRKAAGAAMAPVRHLRRRARSGVGAVTGVAGHLCCRRYQLNTSTIAAMQNTDIQVLFEHNRQWAAQMERERPGFFTSLVKQQKPKYMWIGCSDSRVPANQITGLEPGEVFVHRNVGNIVVHSDLNALSAIQFAVERLKVEHIMVAGHYGCSGVQAALEGARIGLADNWIRHIQSTRDRHRPLIDELPEERRADALCELNTIEQVVNIGVSTVLLDAWGRGQKVSIHGWVFGVNDGLLHDLGMTVNGSDAMEETYRKALDGIANRRRAAG
jgi:carbonic anhydrase